MLEARVRVEIRFGGGVKRTKSRGLEVVGGRIR